MSPRALIAATQSGVVRVTRDDGGGSWTTEPLLSSVDVRCLALDEGVLYAGTQSGDVHRSTDGGRSWSLSHVADAPVKSLAAGHGTVYAGTKEPRVHVSADAGASWRPLAGFTPRRSWWWAQPAERPFRPTYVSALAVVPGTIVAGIEACGVFRSTDRGRTWSGHRHGALRDCHELAFADGCLYEAGFGGLAASTDGGGTWSRRGDGLDRRYGWSVAAAAGTIYLTAAPARSAHTRNSRARVFRAFGDGAWEPCTDELPTLARLSAIADEIFAALGDGTVLGSGDHGDSWEALPVNLGGSSRALLATG